MSSTTVSVQASSSAEAQRTIRLSGSSSVQQIDEAPLPLKTTGALAEYPIVDIAPLCGSQYDSKLNLHDILASPECDAKIRDLAITISERGVIVFPKQENFTLDDEKLLCHKLGQLTTRPHTSGLYIHPLNQHTHPDGTVDPPLTTLARDPSKKLVNNAGFRKNEKKQSHSDGWHTDGSFESIPCDYTLLHMKTTPEAGGDTLFASAYECYDMLSPSLQQFLEAHTATFMPPHHRPENIVDRMWKGSRGSPENVGPELRASHPCVRTNPVTGWKALYANGHHMECIDGLGEEEDKMFRDFLTRLVTENHQLQARVKWSPEDLVIWDNRSVYHCATFDYSAKRIASRICGCGEKPYLDPRSSSRRYALGSA